jgi:hypothetical protein
LVTECNFLIYAVAEEGDIIAKGSYRKSLCRKISSHSPYKAISFLGDIFKEIRNGFNAVAGPSIGNSVVHSPFRACTRKSIIGPSIFSWGLVVRGEQFLRISHLYERFYSKIIIKSRDLLGSMACYQRIMVMELVFSGILG